MIIIFRIIREFWLPGLVAVGWTAINLHAANAWDLKTIVNVFGPSFFLASWATGQFFRIQKQVGVERNLTSIDARIVALVDRLERHTTDFLGYATGGESWVSFSPSLPSPNTLELTLLNQSQYPVFDIYAEIIDLDEPIDPDHGRFWTRHPFVLQSLYPNKAVMNAYRFDLQGQDKLNLNVFIRTRNKGLTQQFRVARVGDWFSIAYKTLVDGAIVDERIPENFPGRDPNNPKAIFG